VVPTATIFPLWVRAALTIVAVLSGTAKRSA
jgi:hypothetical protein